MRGITLFIAASLLSISPAFAAGVAPLHRACEVGAPGAVGCWEWVSPLVSPGRFAVPQAQLFAEQGSMIVVGGWSGPIETRLSGTDGRRYEVAGITAETGAVEWRTSVDFANEASDELLAMTASPDGATVFVTGRTTGFWETAGWTSSTAALDARTGRVLWTAHGRTSGQPEDGTAIAVDPSGATVYVAAAASHTVLRAYDSSTGAEKWNTTFAGPYGQSYPVRVTTAARGVLLVAASVTHGPEFGDGRTPAALAFSAADGTLLWASMLATPLGEYRDAYDLAVSPGGGFAVLTGDVTAAFDLSSGAILWQTDGATDVVLSPDGSTVYLVGGAYLSLPVPFFGDSIAIARAVDSSSGQETWSHVIDHGLNDFPQGISVSHDGRTVAVVTSLEDVVGDTWVHAYSVEGESVWINRFGLGRRDVPAWLQDDVALFSADDARIHLLLQSGNVDEMMLSVALDAEEPFGLG